MIIKRTKIRDLEQHLSKKEISLIIGARQTGKTTLMKELQSDLVKQGKRTVFLSLDFEKDKPFFASQSVLTKKLELEFGKGKGFVFIDEIQRKENAGLFLKGLYDLDLGYKYIVSGSGSLDLKEKIHESLAGRKRIFELSPVTFTEFINYKTDYRYENRLADFFEAETELTESLLNEYMNFGGYPQVVTEKSADEKLKFINEIYNSYLEKDIAYLLKVEKTEAFTSLIKILAEKTGNIINYSELSGTLGISAQTVMNYINLAEKTFILKRITPYFTNIRKEIAKSPQVYFIDLGLRNYSINLFGQVQNESEKGFLFQNFVWQILKNKFEMTGNSLNFWRTKDMAEVDIVLKIGKETIPIEVKYRGYKKPQVKRSFRNFIDRYSPKKAFVITRNFSDNIAINKTEVVFMPFYRLFGENSLNY